MISFPKFRINLKPLLPKGKSTAVDPRKVLKTAQRELLKAVRDEIQAHAFSPRAKIALKRAVGTKTGPNSVTITAKHPAFYPLIEGQKREQMTWLKKALPKPIPIFLDNGKVIFRTPTARSMSNGRWYHPGRHRSHVLDRARKKVRTKIKAHLAEALRVHIRKTMGVR